MHQSNPNSIATGQADVMEPHDLEQGKPRPRPMSRLASYLSTNRNVDRLEPASFDWSSIGAMDEDYTPKPDMMSNAILQQVLTNLTKDLPARYNSFLLHVLEDYRRLIVENEEQSQRLQKEINSHWEDSEQFRQTLELYDRERNILNRVSARSGPISREEAQGDRVSHSSASAENHPVPHPENTTKDSNQLSELNRSVNVTWLKCPRHSLRRHASPSRGMTLASRALLTSETNQEILLPGSGNNSSFLHTANFVEKNLDVGGKPPTDFPRECLPLPQVALISRLAERFAERLGCRPGDLIKEMADICTGSFLQSESDPVLGTVPDIHSPTRADAWHHQITARETKRRDATSLDAARREVIGDRVYQQRFSFYPGDDAKAPSLSDVNTGTEILQLSQSRMPLYDNHPSHQQKSARPPSTDPGSIASVDVQSNGDSNASTTTNIARSQAHRENSARSVATAIKVSSSRSSPGTRKESPKIEQAAARGSSDHSDQKSFAVAAARAAGSRDFSDKRTG